MSAHEPSWISESPTFDTRPSSMRLTLGRHGRVSKQLPHLGGSKVSMTAWLGETRELCLGEDANLSAGTQPEPGCRIWKKMPKMPKTECLESSFRPCTTYHKMLSWIHQQTSSPKTGTSSKGYRSLARKKGNKPIGSYSAKSSTICIWYPDRYQTFCGFLGIVHMFSGKIPLVSLGQCTLRGAKRPLECFDRTFVSSGPCPAISSCANNNFKYLRFQGPGGLAVLLPKKHFSHINGLKQTKTNTFFHFTYMFLPIAETSRHLNPKKQFQSTNSHIPPAVLKKNFLQGARASIVSPHLKWHKHHPLAHPHHERPQPLRSSADDPPDKTGLKKMLRYLP